MTYESIRSSVLPLLGQGNLDGALQTLLDALYSGNNQQAQDQALMLKAQWESLKQDQIKGLLSRADYELAQNKIIAGIQNVVNQLDKPAGGSAGKSPAVRSSRPLFLLGISLFLLLSAFLAYRFNRPKPGATRIPVEQKVPDKIPVNPRPDTSVKVEPVNNPSFRQTTTNKPVPSSSKKSAKSENTPVDTQTAPNWVEVKVIFTKGDVRLKIDGKAPDYLGTSTGLVRTIRISEGKHKFELIENDITCTLPQTILNNTQKIFPTCK